MQQECNKDVKAFLKKTFEFQIAKKFIIYQRIIFKILMIYLFEKISTQL